MATISTSASFNEVKVSRRDTITGEGILFTLDDRGVAFLGLSIAEAQKLVADLAALGIHAPAGEATPVGGVIAEIAAERKRQIEVEGWTPEHDDEHRGGVMALAAGCYALASTGAPRAAEHWPWDRNWWKPKDRRSDLIRAAALVVAELERLDRRAAREVV